MIPRLEVALSELPLLSESERYAHFRAMIATALRLHGCYCFEWCCLEDHRQAQADAHGEFAARLLLELESAGWATHFWTNPSFDDVPEEEPTQPGEQRQMHLYIGSREQIDGFLELNREREFMGFQPLDNAP
jgi:hypothetical protein